MGHISKRSWWFYNEIYTHALLIVPHLLCNGPSVFATGGSTCQTDFLESPVQQSAFVPDCQGVTGNDLLKSIRVRDLKKMFHCVRSMGRGGGQRPILVKYVYFGKKLETLIRMKKLEKISCRTWRQKYQQFFSAVALKWMALFCTHQEMW
jgi:hypothetical protein